MAFFQVAETLTLTFSGYCHRPILLLQRHLFTSPSAAAEARRARKRRLNAPIPSLSSLLQTPRQPPPPNPNAPRLPEPPAVAASAARVDLHNKVLSLIIAGDAPEASLLVRHHVYSHCPPTIHTVNAALSALLRSGLPAEALSLYNFTNQARLPPSISTYNHLLQAHLDLGRVNAALENYRTILKDSTLSPSPTTYRILIKALVERSNLDEAVRLKNEMLDHCQLSPDPITYNLLMSGFLKSNSPDTVIALFDELRQGSGGHVKDGAVYGSLLKGYFMKGMPEQAMEWYNIALCEDLNVKFKAETYNSVLEALSRNSRLDVALSLFDRMLNEHKPPVRITVDTSSFNIIVDGYFEAEKFYDAIAVFRNMGEKQCQADVYAYNNIIGQLGRNHLDKEAERFHKEMEEQGIGPDEETYTLLVEALFRVGRVEGAVGYFRRMMELNLRPNADSYNKLIGGLVSAGRIADAKEFYDQMIERAVKRNAPSYEILIKAFCEASRVDDALKVTRDLLMEEDVCLRPEMKEVVEAALAKEGRQDALERLSVDVEREKADALARAAEEKARALALAKEEAARRKAEEAAREEAAARESARAIEAILQRKFFVGDGEEKLSPSLDSSPVGDRLLKEVESNTESIHVS